MRNGNGSTWTPCSKPGSRDRRSRGRLRLPTLVTIDISWAEPGSGPSILFDIRAIDWLQEAGVQAIAQQVGLNWNAVDEIQRQAVT